MNTTLELNGTLKYFKTQHGQVPALGLGTWKMEDGVGYDAVRNAIDVGYRHLDCAWVYQNENDVGRAIGDCIRAGTVQREDLWITSKLWNDRHHPENVKGAIEESLRALGLDYLDLYLMHWPVAHQLGAIHPESSDQLVPPSELPLSETWSAMAQLQTKGLTRHIGVSNFSIRKIDQLIDSTGITPSFNQVESHPYLQQPQLADYCTDNEIILTAYSPLGSPDRPDSMRQQVEPKLLQDEVLQQIADKHNITIGQVILSWAVCRGTLPIPKAASQEHLTQNLAAADISLDDEDMQQIARLDKKHRYVDGTFWELPGSSYTAASIWDE